MKSRWPDIGEVEPPEGAELADDKPADKSQKDKRKRETVKVRLLFIPYLSHELMIWGQIISKSLVLAFLVKKFFEIFFYLSFL